jgi:hypothetical protein
MGNKGSTSTNRGMTPMLRSPALLSGDRLLRFARVAGPVYARHGAPNTAAVCDAYVQVVAENDLLRRQLASFDEWSDEPTRRTDPVDDDALLASLFSDDKGPTGT